MECVILLKENYLYQMIHFDETVSGNIRCLEESVYEVELLDSKNNEMGLMIYRPGFIDLEIETAILKSDVSVFLGNRMGFTIPL